MAICETDLYLLQRGEPPASEDTLKKMTIGREYWLDYIYNHYLQKYIANGGSKVKILVGKQGVGKTHLLKSVLADAKVLNYQTVYLSALECRLNDLVSLYQHLAQQIDYEGIVRGLCRQVALSISKETEYDGSGVFAPFIYHLYPSPKMADEEVMKAVSNFLKRTDLRLSFKAFAYGVTRYRMIDNAQSSIDSACRWLAGESIDRNGRSSLHLYEKLDRVNARDWLNSLILLCRLAGYKGLVVAIDNLEIIGQKNDKNRYFYTKKQVDDLCEIVRQLIDDTEILANCLFLLSGRREIIENNDRSFRAYDALWIRIQTGLANYDRFNPFADLVDIDKHLKAQGQSFLPQVFQRIQELAQDSQETNLSPPPNYRNQMSELQQMIIDAVCQRRG